MQKLRFIKGMNASVIKHEGIVSAITNENIQVSIINASACSSCHAKGACSVSDMQEKIIDAQPNGKTYKIGDRVVLISSEKKGMKALLLGYVYPFLLVLFTLIVATLLEFKETIAGLIALAILLPYYGMLFVFKDKMRKTFTFDIE